MARYGVPDKPFILFLSSDGRAPGIWPHRREPGRGFCHLVATRPISPSSAWSPSTSRRVNSGDRLNRTKFADNPVLIKILGERLKQNRSLVSSQEEADQRAASLTRGITGTLTSAAEVIITTPLNVIRIAVGQ